MKIQLTAAAILALASSAFALDGQIGIHDPGTVTLCDGKFYTWGTGGTPLVSDDGWTWRGGVRASRSGAAPDTIRVGDRYYMYISGVTMIYNKTLDPNSPDFKWEDGGNIAGYDGPGDFVNPIDPAALLGPDGRMWLTYGSYVGFLRLVELDPKTGKRLHPEQAPYNIAVNCEASCMIYHDGWYYLTATHGSCCRGADSGYNIRVGRAKQPTGPFLDNMGVDMIQGGGWQLCGSGGRVIGPGHFGLIDLGDGVQRFSLHWEADLDHGGGSVLDILPLVWKDGWPEAGENFKPGTYQIASVRTGTALELAVEEVAVGGGRGGRGGGGGGARGGAGRGAPGAAPDTNAAPARGGDAAAPADAAARGARGPGGGGGMGGGMFGGQGGVVPPQDVAQVSTNWPAGNTDVRLANYMCQAQQKWTVTAVTNAGGWLGSPFFKITIAGTDRALAVSPEMELVTLPAFTGAPEQLWCIEQLPDATWRLTPKSLRGTKQALTMSAVGSGFASLAKYNADSDRQRWLFKAP